MDSVVEMNASEALYGFAGWLTTRKQSVVAGAEHNAACWAELVDEFIKNNDLSPVRDDIWPDNMNTHPN